MRRRLFRNYGLGDGGSMFMGFIILSIIFAAYLIVGGVGRDRSSETASIGSPPATGNFITWTTTSAINEGGSPRLVKTLDGNWLAAITTIVSNSRSEIKIYKSTDNARTWTYLTTVNDGNRKVDNGMLFQLPSGDVLLAGRNLIDGTSYRISLWRSTNAGKSWSSPSTIDSNEKPRGRTDRGLWEPFLYTLPDGKLTILYANETHAASGYNQVISQRISPDNGVSWGKETWAVAKTHGRPGMPFAVRMTNGKYILVYEACLIAPNCGVFHKESPDGSTWGNDLGAAIPDQHCGPSITSLVDGRLVVTSCSNALSYSEDFGASWRSNEAAFTSGDWPAIYAISSNEVAAIVGGGSRIRYGTVIPK